MRCPLRANCPLLILEFMADGSGVDDSSVAMPKARTHINGVYIEVTADEIPQNPKDRPPYVCFYREEKKCLCEVSGVHPATPETPEKIRLPHFRRKAHQSHSGDCRFNWPSRVNRIRDEPGEPLLEHDGKIWRLPLPNAFRYAPRTRKPSDEKTELVVAEQESTLLNRALLVEQLRQDFEADRLGLPEEFHARCGKRPVSWPEFFHAYHRIPTLARYLQRKNLQEGVTPKGTDWPVAIQLNSWTGEPRLSRRNIRGQSKFLLHQRHEKVAVIPQALNDEYGSEMPLVVSLQLSELRFIQEYDLTTEPLTILGHAELHLVEKATAYLNIDITRPTQITRSKNASRGQEI
ncbi:Uncharacterised protein [Mycobacteroides abscessus subsp. abscessus]|nr:Uncharacterised protein [Mycobacteroides abscessus]SIE07654.1 Uncharacterised protein [Mycobacteroides abscessus subsp. abscessus]SKQ25491.1 Uncharacterised protein [Mycobacteroides abscessus subsp. massiliense]CPS46479.1 Uncharacterised protein [Mycobacteroides abscessus]CPY73536.1 Uncharacterised protein [Mycobacteroides abscessus]